MKFVVFAVCSAVGFAVGHYLLDGPAAIYGSLLVSYHLFLAYLVLTSGRGIGTSMPIIHTLVTHLACLGLLIGIAMGRHYVPLFGMIRYFIPGLAPFEVDWLFGKPRKQQHFDTQTSPLPFYGTAHDYRDFLEHAAMKDRPFARPGRTIQQEYALWLASRYKIKPGELDKAGIANSAVSDDSSRVYPLEISTSPLPQDNSYL